MSRKTTKNPPSSSPRMVKKWEFVSSPSVSPRKSGATASYESGTDAYGTKIAEVRGQVDEVANQMEKNVQGIIRREEGLEEALERSRKIEENAKILAKKLEETNRKMWWKQNRCWIVLFVAILLVIVTIILSVTLGRNSNGRNSNG